MAIAYIFTAALFCVIFTREVIAPASGASCDKRWQYLAGALSAANLGIVIAAGFVFERVINDRSVLHLQRYLDPLSGGVLAFIVSSFVAYWWHRATHASNTLWRLIHQLHHAPPRIEALTAFYLHPLDSFFAVLLNIGVAYGLMGVNGLSLAVALALAALFDLVAHADQKTPKWLGWFIQRPEMHRIHHQHGHHRQNYGLPVWDKMFGTYINPDRPPVACGFSPERANRVRDMLLFQDVHRSSGTTKPRS